MLLEFSVANFRSFREKQTLRMDASAIKEFGDNVVKEGGYKVLKSAAIYGANSSGKSNFVRAMGVMQHIIFNREGRSSEAPIPGIEPFELNEATHAQPSLFEVLLLVGGIRYRYGFEATTDRVVAEWLYQKETPKSKEKSLFERKDNYINNINFKEGEELLRVFKNLSVNKNSLFISYTDNSGGEISQKIVHWAKYWRIMGASDSDSKGNRVFTNNFLIYDTKERENILQLLKPFDLGFNDLRIDRTQISRLRSVHSIYDSNGNIVGEKEFTFDGKESDGTKKVYDLSGVILQMLQQGGVLVVDELDRSLHPHLTIRLINLFHNPETNPNHAQLIFSTHDTNLLSAGNLRRDEIWFIEKDATESSTLYPLLDFDLRNDASLENRYLNGRFGAVPQFSLDSFVPTIQP